MSKSLSYKSKQSTPSYNTDSTSPETDYPEEEESSTANNSTSNFSSSNEPTPFDDRGRCIKHPHIRLRRKKMLGGWKIMMTNCPDCCIEQMLAMRNEQQRSKGGGSKKGSGDRRRSSSRDSNGSRSQGGRNQRKPSPGMNKSGAVRRSESVDSSRNMPPISQLTIRTSDGGGDNASDCGSMGSSASEITYGTNGGRSNNSAGFHSGGSGSNDYPHHVTRMPFTDAYGDKGWYTGEVASISGLPHGKGTMHYCDGRVRDGLWSNGMAGGTLQQQKRSGDGSVTSSHGALSPLMTRGSNGSSVESPPQQQQQFQQREKRRPIIKTDMPWTDLIGESGLYTGQTDKNGEPHGMGVMRYHDGSSLEGEWYHGELERRRESGGEQGGSQGRSRGQPVTRF